MTPRSHGRPHGVLGASTGRVPGRRRSKRTTPWFPGRGGNLARSSLMAPSLAQPGGAAAASSSFMASSVLSLDSAPGTLPGNSDLSPRGKGLTLPLAPSAPEGPFETIFQDGRPSGPDSPVAQHGVVGEPIQKTSPG